jgi:hypothetical protein
MRLSFPNWERKKGFVPIVLSPIFPQRGALFSNPSASHKNVSLPSTSEVAVVAFELSPDVQYHRDWALE